MRIKYTKEILEEAVRDVYSAAALARKLGLAPTGSNTTNLRRRCQQFDVDISHFTGQAHNRNNPARNRKTPDEWLVLNEDPLAVRIPGKVLCRVLQEIGTDYKCSVCGISEWNNQPLQLQIDHIDGNFRNNRKENLRFICPNCHSQTDTWGSKNK